MSDEELKLPPLETECPTCRMTGEVLPRIEDGAMGTTCPTCGGKGFLPTQAGNQVLALMRRYFPYR